MKIHKPFGIIACVFLFGFLTACGSSPSARLYILEPVAAGAADNSDESLTVMINQVTLAQYLARKEILSRQQHYVVDAAEFDRWAEPLEDNITSVLAENVSNLVASDGVIAYPWHVKGSADFSVSVQILAFGPGPGGIVELSALWRISNSEGDTVALEKSAYSVVPASNEVTATVAAMSQTLGELSGDIAATLLRSP